MGWGCYKHEMDATSQQWREIADALCAAKLKEDPKTFGRDCEVCPTCWIELTEERTRLRDALVRAQSLIGHLMPGIKYISVEDYAEVNDVPTEIIKVLQTTGERNRSE